MNAESHASPADRPTLVRREVTGGCSTEISCCPLARAPPTYRLSTQRELHIRRGRKYDVILWTNVGQRPPAVLQETGALTTTVIRPDRRRRPPNGQGSGRWWPGHGLDVLSLFIKQEMGMMSAASYPSRFDLLAGAHQSGDLTPVIDRRYTLSEVPEAIRYLETGRARGKVIINME